MVRAEKKRKVAVVMSGGGMQCAFGAGALIALGEYYTMQEPDFLVAPSGAAATAAYFVSGQYDKVSLMWMSYASDPKFISLRRRPVVDIDYLITDVLMQRAPLDLKRFNQSDTKLLFPVTRARDGALVYLRAAHTKAIYTQIHATLAAPYIYGRKVVIRGESYMDGFFGASIHDYIEHVVSLGAEDVIVLASSSQEYRGVTKAFLKSVVTYGRQLGIDPAVVRATEHEMKQKKQYEPPAGVRVAVVVPPKKLALSLLGGTKFNYRKVFNDGYESVVKSKDIAALLAKI